MTTTAVARRAALCAAILAGLPTLAACTSQAPRAATVASPSPTGAVAPPTSALMDACGPTYQMSHRCRRGAQTIESLLLRKLHLPGGGTCNTTKGRSFGSPDFGGIALGRGAVRPLVAMGPTKLVRQGVVPLAHRGRWLAFKTLWFSLPSYDGPFIVRARRLDGSGRVRFGETPSAPEIVVRGPTVNQSHGYREVPGGTWLKAPGCYAWQVDGQGFSHVIVFEAVLHGH